MDAIKVGNTIAFLRKKSGLTQKQLAQKLDVTDKAVSRWERGIGTPDISLLTKLSAVLDTDIEAVLEGNFTNKEPDCLGLLIMKYPKNIYASTFIYTKRVVYFQLSFFLLAGIREICIFGKKEDVNFTKSQLGVGSSLGIKLTYEYTNDDSDMDVNKSEFYIQKSNKYPFLVINGLDFLYGKDITSTITRLILDSIHCTTIANYQKKILSIKFYPSKLRQNSQNECNEKTYSLFRGVIAFPINNEKGLFDAGLILKIIEEQYGDIVADLDEIVRNRGFLNSTEK